MRKGRKLMTGPWRTPAKTGLQDDICAFKATLCGLLDNFQKGYKVLLKFP